MNTKSQKVGFAMLCFFPTILSAALFWYDQTLHGIETIGVSIVLLIAFFTFGVLPSVGMTIAGLLQIIGLQRRGEPVLYYLFCTVIASLPWVAAAYAYVSSP